MSRRGSFTAVIRRAAREHAAAERAHARQAASARKQHVKAVRAAYLQNRSEDAEMQTQEVTERLSELNSILPTLLGFSGYSLQSLKRTASLNDLPEEMDPGKPPVEASYAPPPLGFFSSLFSSKVEAYNRTVSAGRTAYQQAISDHANACERRDQAFIALTEEVENHNRMLLTIEEGAADGNAEDIVTYTELILGNAPLPDGFSDEFKIGIVPSSAQLVVEFTVPRIDDMIPTERSFSYVKSSDKITSKPMPAKMRSGAYADAVAQATLGITHFILGSPRLTSISTVIVSGFVSTRDPSTGLQIRPCLISLRTSRSEFESLDLHNVDPIACLKRLNAAVSKSPAELQAVRPVIDFNMVDPRFVSETDVLSSIDQRPNLMELTPSEFESLITNLFTKMGLDTKLTQASRDGGVDCVAFDPRPVLGGKVVVQAKRYRHTVGVSAVRDLFGTVHNEGASKGILVTTSGFGRASYDFANGKPLELLTGENLLYMLATHAGVEAKIEFPDDWRDPIPTAEVD